jgi:putative inorganic carbon (HCO3(-)) transporter
MSCLDRATSGLLVAFIFAGPLLISPWAFDRAILVKESFLLLVSGVLLTLSFLGAIVRRTPFLQGTPLARPIILILLFAVLSLFKAVNLYAASSRLALMLAGLSLYWVATHARIRGDEISAFAKAAVASGLIAAVYAVFQSAGLDPFPPSAVGLTSTLGNPNFLAEYLALAIPLCLGLIFTSERPREKRLLGLATIVLVTGLLLSKSKAASLGLAFSVVWFGFLLRHHRTADLRGEVRRLAPYAAVSLILAGVFASWYLSRFVGHEGIRDVLRGYAASQSIYFQWRLVFYRDALRMILDNPLLGVGIGNFASVHPIYRSMPETLDPGNHILEHAHNDFLELGAEIGLPGLFGLLWMLCALFRRMLQPGSGPPLSYGFAASVGALAVNGLFAFGLQNPIPFAAFWLSTALALRLHDGPVLKTHQWPRTMPNDRPPLWAVLLALPALGGLSYVSLRPLVADAYLSRGDTFFKAGRLRQSIPPLESAARLAPGSRAAQHKLAQAYLSAGRHREAVAVLDAYLRFDRYNFETLYIKGLYAEQGGDVGAALKAYETARKVYPLYSKPLQRIGIIRESQGDARGAMAAYREAIRLNPAFAGASNNLAVLLSSQGNLDEAIRIWEEAAERNPGDLIIAGNLVSAYRIMGDREKALSWEERVRRLRGHTRQQSRSR